MLIGVKVNYVVKPGEVLAACFNEETMNLHSGALQLHIRHLHFAWDTAHTTA